MQNPPLALYRNGFNKNYKLLRHLLKIIKIQIKSMAYINIENYKKLDFFTSNEYKNRRDCEANLNFKKTKPASCAGFVLRLLKTTVF
jgi:hypothetical protein